ncbi:MAG: HprK-related kinase B [Candidatus Coatesbacteria bacterium]|nr:HprK-related kinase B [Candidatus Coatesbacteria bacterium]
MSVESIKEKLLKELILKETLYLKFVNVNIKVVSNSSALISCLKSYYNRFISIDSGESIRIIAIESDNKEFNVNYLIKEPDPGKTRIKEEYIDLEDGRIVRKVLTGLVFIFGGGTNIACGECIKNSNQIVNFINNRYIEWMLKNGCLLFHSAGILGEGLGIAISGFSGAGKSTLALNFLDRNFLFLSNDRIMMKRVANKTYMYGVPKYPRVNPGTLLASPSLMKILKEEERKEFLKIPKDKLWNLEHKYDVFIEEIFHKEVFILESEINALIILNWKRVKDPFFIKRIDLSERTDLIPVFAKSPGLFFQLSSNDKYNSTDQSYLKCLENCAVFEITGGIDFNLVRKEIMMILRKTKV